MPDRIALAASRYSWLRLPGRVGTLCQRPAHAKPNVLASRGLHLPSSYAYSRAYILRLLTSFTEIFLSLFVNRSIPSPSVNTNKPLRPTTMDNKQEEPKWNVRIQYAEDVETGPRARRRRRDSEDSMSICSMRSLSRQRVDPGTMLPIQYRTVSYNIEESKARQEQQIEAATNLRKVGKADKTAIEFTDLDWQKVWWLLNFDPKASF
jgi:hypothetical protein